jgi:hypothetical protein
MRSKELKIYRMENQRMLFKSFKMKIKCQLRSIN